MIYYFYLYRSIVSSPFLNIIFSSYYCKTIIPICQLHFYINLNNEFNNFENHHKITINFLEIFVFYSKKKLVYRIKLASFSFLILSKLWNSFISRLSSGSTKIVYGSIEVVIYNFFASHNDWYKHQSSYI